MHRWKKIFLAVAVAGFGARAADAASTDDFEFFEKKIRPVLSEKCFRCHSAQSEKLKGELHLDTKEGILKGGESGHPAVVPGAPDKSRLIEAIRYQNENLQMPPKERLKPEVVADFEHWIAAGAPYPASAAETSRTKTVASKPHWAFQPVQHPAVPRVKNRRWPQNPVDHFILQKLEQNSLAPSAPADRATLLRRVTYDLTGLPPTPEELESFLKDRSPRAYEKAVERLLASPAYGERWARMWLDIARYSDTKGYAYGREERRFVHSHVYRDWVVRAFNTDLPYNQFVSLQLAADQLDVPKSDLAAMGFLTIGRRFLGVQHDIIDDRIDVISRGLLGLTVGCARCHDHKFDPIPTRDYYSFYGVLMNTTEKMFPLEEKSATDPAYQAFLAELKKRTDKFEQTFTKKQNDLTARLRTKAAEYLQAVLDVKKLHTEEFYAFLGPDDLNPVIVRQWQTYIFETSKSFHPVFAFWHEMTKVPESEFAARAPQVLEKLENGPEGRRLNPIVARAFREKPPQSMKEVAATYGKLFADGNEHWKDATKPASPEEEPLRLVLYGNDSPTQIPKGTINEIEWFFDEGSRVEMSNLQAEIDRWIISSAGAPDYGVVLEDRAQLQPARVFLRGNPANRGEEAPRQFLKLLSPGGQKPFEKGSGRLELARAIVDPRNPLTARVIVNRIWSHHFGAGLVATPSDFGTRSEPPTHPELLDWLASYFMDHGWSIKELHRVILLSSTYQQSSGASSEEKNPRITRARQKDPENRWLWRMNRQRLDFEEMRDSVLDVSGSLSPVLGGKPGDVMSPPFNSRRTLYALVDRQFLPGMYRVFDFANPDTHSPQRYVTTIPQQALFFLNSPFIMDQAKSLVKQKDVAEAGRTDRQVEALFRRVLQRPPSAVQLKSAIRFVEETQAALKTEADAPKPRSEWSYGYGEFDAARERTAGFVPLPYFSGAAWQGGPAYPDPGLGWIQITAAGGHPGNDLKHAAIRRWTAPVSGTIRIAGAVSTEVADGDGICARIISSRSGPLKTWEVHNQKFETTFDNVVVEKGDALDFMVDIRNQLLSDMFKWPVTISYAQMAGSTLPKSAWDSSKEFGGPSPEPLSPIEQLAQVLLLSNEFMFID